MMYMHEWLLRAMKNTEITTSCTHKTDKQLLSEEVSTQNILFT